MAGGAMAQGAARAGAAAGSGADDAGSGGKAQGITTGWNRLDSWSDDLAATVNNNHDECVTNRFHLDNPVAAGVADAADEATSGEEGGACPRLTSGWTTLDTWAGEITDKVDSNHAECVSDSASGGSKCPTLDSGWKRLNKWAAKIAAVIDSNHDECIRLKPSHDQSDTDMEQQRPSDEELGETCVLFGHEWSYYDNALYWWRPDLGLPSPSGYYSPPTGNANWNKEWCRRVIRFTYDPSLSSVSEQESWTNGSFDSPSDHIIGEFPLDFWFQPSAEAVNDLITNWPVGLSSQPPDDIKLEFTIWLTMYRPMHTVWIHDPGDEETPPSDSKQHDAPDGDETTSVPWIDGLCYKRI